MTKAKILDKRTVLLIILTCFSVHMHSIGTNSKIVSKSNYIKKSDWGEIEKAFLELWIDYTLGDFRGTPIITELYYYGKDRSGKKVLLGSFTKDGGFLDSRNEEFVQDPELKKDASFFRTYLLGLSIDCIEYPFSLRGIAISSENMIYETENLCRLQINCEKSTLEEWFPDL